MEQESWLDTYISAVSLPTFLGVLFGLLEGDVPTVLMMAFVIQGFFIGCLAFISLLTEGFSKKVFGLTMVPVTAFFVCHLLSSP